MRRHRTKIRFPYGSTWIVPVTIWHHHLRTFIPRHERMRGFLLREYRRGVLSEDAPHHEPGPEHPDDTGEPESDDPTLI